MSQQIDRQITSIQKDNIQIDQQVQQGTNTNSKNNNLQIDTQGQPVQQDKRHTDHQTNQHTDQENNRQTGQEVQSNKRIKLGNGTIKQHQQEAQQPQQFDLSVLYADGACNKKTGDCAWGSVVDSKGQDLIETYLHLLTDMQTEVKQLPSNKGLRRILIAKFNDIKTQNNNGAELLALVALLRIAMVESDHVLIGFTDSDTIYKYWSNNHINPVTKANMDPRKLQYVEECIRLRKQFEDSGGQVLKVDGDDNKADLGFHIAKGANKKRKHSISIIKS